MTSVFPVVNENIMSCALQDTSVTSESVRVASPIILPVGNTPGYIITTGKDGTPVAITVLNERRRRFERWIRAVWRTLVTIFFIMSAIMLVIGSLYAHRCSGSSFIPTYMIVSGIIGLLQFLVMTVECCAPETDRRTLTSKHTIYSCTNVFFGLFLGWTFFGSILILTTSIQSNDPKGHYYCNDILYFLAYYMAVVFDVMYIALGITGFLVLCLCGLLTPGAYIK